jgi:hypothetical protein
MGTPAILSSVPNVNPYIQYVAMNGQTVFPYPFPITQDADLIVVINGVTQPTDSGYTLSGVGQSNGGSLTFTLGRTTGDIITLYRNIAIQRVTQITQNAGFSSTTFNTEYNQIYLILQQLQESLSFALQIPNTNSGGPVTLLTPGAYANKYLAFDVNGNPTPALLTSSGALTQAILTGLLNPQTSAETAAGVTAVNLAYPVLSVDRYGTNLVPGTTDMLTAINAAIAVATQLGGGTVQFGANTYFHSAAIALNKYVILKGVGQIATVLLSTHAGNGITSTWPVNSSTAVFENVSNLTIKNTNGVNTGAGFVDIGGTFVILERVKIQGFKYSVILDQTEQADLDYCDFEFPLTAGVWLVNGGDYAPASTANAGFTNRVSIYRSQFNSAVGTATAIIDDGGNGHSFTDLNIDGFGVQLRAAAAVNLKISGGLWSVGGSVPIQFVGTTSVLGTNVGPSYGVLLDNVQIGPNGATGACINITALHQAQIIGGYFATTAAAAITGANACTNMNCIGVAFASTTLVDSFPIVYLQSDTAGLQTNMSATITSGAMKLVSTALAYTDSQLSLAGTIAVNAALANKFKITFNSNASDTFGAPSNPVDGQQIAIQIFNTSGGALTNIAWNAVYKIPALTYPATGNNRTYVFTYNIANTAWYFEWQTASDVPN